MTKNNAKKLLDENAEFQGVVLKIIEELDGISVSDCKKILDAVNCFIVENTLIDAETTKSLIVDGESDE